MIIFILGSGRSGTHFIGRYIDTNLLVQSSIESDRSFELSVKIATQYQNHDENVRELLTIYSERSEQIYLEKSHTNLWIAEKLADALPNALFVAITRDPRAVAASTLKHGGVAGWLEKPYGDAKLDKFLGRKGVDRQTYKKMTVAERSTLRWIAHTEETQRLEDVLGERILSINYEQFILKNEVWHQKLESFLDLNLPLAQDAVDKTPLLKWKKDLTVAQQKQVAKTVRGFSGTKYLESNLEFLNDKH